MKILKEGSRGPAVSFLQLALNRAGFGVIGTDGIFGPATRAALISFQQSRGLSPDGIAGSLTRSALMPWYTGVTKHIVRAGESFYKISQAYGCSVNEILSANPGLRPDNLPAGALITVPLSFPTVPSDINYSSEIIRLSIKGLCARYPFIQPSEIGSSVMGKPLYCLKIGRGKRKSLYAAAFHANEWITVPLLLTFLEELASAYVNKGEIYGRKAEEILKFSTIYLIPAVNPDGVDLVTGELCSGRYYEMAGKIASRYPRYPFPEGWKANILGTDLNLQFPAGWEKARENKFAAGIISPAPADYVGPAPLSAPESRAVHAFAMRLRPELLLAYHTQGQIIYWKYLDMEPPGSRKLCEAFTLASGYPCESTPYASGFAGFKDWFIQDFMRPGFTVEAGKGKNPLPISDFPQIYRDNLGILTLGAIMA